MLAGLVLYFGTTSPLRGGVDRNLPKFAAQLQKECRPFAGAWIETTATPASLRSTLSPLRGGVDRNSVSHQLGAFLYVAPSRGRGSKQRLYRRGRGLERVAPSRGRGSKHPRPVRRQEAPSVAPSRGRGSKLNDPKVEHMPKPVAPSRGRGSKLLLSEGWCGSGSSPLRGGVDRNEDFRSKEARIWRRPFGGVDRNPGLPIVEHAASRSPLRGGVDRNVTGWTPQMPNNGRPFAGAWIETSSCS